MPEYRIRLLAFNSVAVITLGIVASIVTSTVIASGAYRSKYKEAAKVQQSIVVKGKSTQRVRSDRGHWWINVNGNGVTIQEAHATLASGMKEVLSFLDDRGFASEEIEHGPISTTVYYEHDEDGNATRQVIEYVLTQRISITTDDVDSIAKAAGEVTDLLKDGIFVVGGIPSYTFSTAGEVKVHILSEASANARRRAEELAVQAGGTVTSIKYIHQGVIQITTPDSTRVSSYGMYDTSTIMKDISVVVTVEFGIDNS